MDELKPPRASTNLKEHYDMAQMSKTLATIDIDADIAYKLADAHLEQVSDLYTEEAYLLCKRLEFKNLLGRFSVEAPKNTAEEHFKKIEKAQEAEAFLHPCVEKHVDSMWCHRRKRMTPTQRLTVR